MPSTSYDLIVVGAGPGGATAAGFAAAAGLRVLLVDRAAFPRDKICGDAISGKSLNVLRRLALLDRIEAGDAIALGGILFSSPGGDEVEIPFRANAECGYPPGFACAREVFDNILVERAVELGAELQEAAPVTGLIQESGTVRGVRLKQSDTETKVHAPIVIGADGAYSIVARELGMTQLDERHYYAGVRAYYEGLDSFRGDNYIELHFVDEAIPGYFWIFPMANGRANVGMGTLSRRIKKEGVQLKSLLDETIAGPRFGGRFQSVHRVGRVRGWGMPLGSAPRTMAGNGWMLAGDAASLIDPFTGEGIGNAMLSGELAAGWAEAALEEGDASVEVLGGYADEVHHVLDSELRLSYTLRRLERWRWLLNAVIRKAGRRPEVAETISSMFADLGKRKQLASPLFYLRVLSA